MFSLEKIQLGLGLWSVTISEDESLEIIDQKIGEIVEGLAATTLSSDERELPSICIYSTQNIVSKTVSLYQWAMGSFASSSSSTMDDPSEADVSQSEQENEKQAQKERAQNASVAYLLTLFNKVYEIKEYSQFVNNLEEIEDLNSKLLRLLDQIQQTKNFTFSNQEYGERTIFSNSCATLADTITFNSISWGIDQIMRPQLVLIDQLSKEVQTIQQACERKPYKDIQNFEDKKYGEIERTRQSSIKNIVLKKVNIGEIVKEFLVPKQFLHDCCRQSFFINDQKIDFGINKQFFESDAERKDYYFDFYVNIFVENGLEDWQIQNFLYCDRQDIVFEPTVAMFKKFDVGGSETCQIQTSDGKTVSYTERMFLSQKDVKVSIDYERDFSSGKFLYLEMSYYVPVNITALRNYSPDEYQAGIGYYEARINLLTKPTTDIVKKLVSDVFKSQEMKVLGAESLPENVQDAKMRWGWKLF